MDKGLIPRIADDGTPAGPHQVPSKNEGQRQTGLKEYSIITVFTDKDNRK